MRSAAAAALAGLLAACGSVGPAEPIEVAGACALSIAPAVLSMRTAGLVPRQGEVTLTTDRPCLVRLAVQGAPEWRLDGPRALDLDPNAPASVPLTLDPAREGTFAGTLTATPATGVPVEVALVGWTGDPPPRAELIVSPDRVEFADTAPQCGQDQGLATWNHGDAPGAWARATLEGPHADQFSLRFVELDRVVEPGRQSPNGLVQFEPTTYGAKQATLRFVSGSGARFEVALSGRATVIELEDVFEQAPAQQLDLLLVLDDAGSLRSASATIAAHFAAIVAEMNRRDVDYQIGAVAARGTPDGPSGHLVPVSADAPYVVTSSTATAAVARLVRAVTSSESTSLHQGLEAARLALSPPLINEHNAGLLRAGSRFVYVFVSATPDASPHPLTLYGSFLRSRGGVGPWTRPIAVTGGAAGCRGPGGDVPPAPAYADVMETVEGVEVSLCASALRAELRAAISGQPQGDFRNRRFELTDLADPDSLEVEVDGRPVPAKDEAGLNWIYDFETNDLVFTEAAVPAYGAQLRVGYHKRCR